MFDTGAATHVGKVRKRNEDCYLVRPESGIWAVADGMGGHDAGHLASRAVVDALRLIEPANSAADLLRRCEDSLLRANMRVREIARQRGGGIVGTTLAALLAYDGDYACVWSGDSRIYLVRSGQIVQLSRDHTEVQELVAAGVISPQEARTWAGRNVITRAIGAFDSPELEMEDGTLAPGDVFVICSDGLTNYVADDEIRDCVATSPPQRACETLISLTLDRGAADNVTVVVVRYQPEIPSAAQVDGGRRDLWE